MSRKELAAAVNAYVRAATGRTSGIRATEIGRYERGEVHWPNKAYRQALRTILQADNDAELGFYPTRRGPIRRDEQAGTLGLRGQIDARALIRRAGQVLVIRPSSANWFGLPGGYVDPSQSVLSTLTSRVAEQTGLGIVVAGFAGGVEHPAEEGRPRVLTLTFEARVTGEVGRHPMHRQTEWLAPAELADHDVRPIVLRQALTAGAEGAFWRVGAR